MATTVAQHSVATFTSPVNGTTPIDANTVRGNDNTIRTAYNDHDADTGIHVQSSTLASRPPAGTAGRKWITTDAGSQKLWYDDGTDWHEVGGDSINVYCKATETIVKGDVLKITGYNVGQNVPEVAKVASASDVAFGIAEAAIASGSLGYVINTGVLSDVNTAAFTLGDILYPNTSGGFTATKPTSGNYQPCAYVLRSNTNNGVLYVEFSAPRIVERSDNTASTVVLRDASGNFSAGTITAALTGNATTATTATQVANALTAGTYLTSAGTYNGSAARTFAVDATDANTASKVVARDASGNFSAGTITATLSGTATNASNLTGTTNQIRAVSYTFPAAQGGASTVLTNDGSGNLSWAAAGAAAAGSLTGTTLAANVVSSSLTSVGTLSSLTVSGDLTVDTNTLKVNSTANRVGVLNATPGSTFHIGSTVATGGLADSNWNANITAASNTQLCVQDGVVQGYLGAIGTFATPEFRLATYTNHPFKFLVGNSNVGAFINNTGSFILNGSTPRLGINSATPGTLLHIDSTVATGGLADSNWIANITSASNTNLCVQDATVQGFVSAIGTFATPEFRIGTYTNHPIAFTNNNVTRWRISTSGHFLAETDATYDIGASGATRPRNYFGSGTLTVGGAATADSVQSVKCVSVGNATPSTSGAGITFPATQSASSDANTLDDYEEGTWTPTQGAGITLVGTFSSAGSYTKVGRLVHAYGYVAGSTSVALTAAGSVVCAGLPFTAPAAEGQMGVLGNSATTASSALQLSSATIYNNGTIAATTKIFITVSYYV